MRKQQKAIIGRHSIKWIKAYLECLNDKRAVHVFELPKRQMELRL
jgi:hypothetical protein